MSELAQDSVVATAEVHDMVQIKIKRKPFYDFIKRCFDIIASLLVLLILSPVLLIVSICIAVDDFGNPFFSQERTGKDNKVFRMYKFRSMYKDAEKRKEELMALNEADSRIFKMENDPRITKVGRFIRRTSIDELPQLVNILKGEMSIVGPRPFICKEQANCTEYQAQRLLVKPGLSCYAALDHRSHDDFDLWMEHDLRYIEERGVIADLKVIFGTIKLVFMGHNQ